MSHVLRSLVRQSSQNIRGIFFPTVQVRNVGNLPIKPNKYIEEWNNHRENIEHTFK